jgi:hypothetical protein
MSERRKAVDDAEAAFCNEQTEDAKGTLETAKELEAAASRGAARIETRAATIETPPATPSKSGRDAASNRRRKSRTQASSTPTLATNGNSANTPESASRSSTPTQATDASSTPARATTPMQPTSPNEPPNTQPPTQHSSPPTMIRPNTDHRSTELSSTAGFSQLNHKNIVTAVLRDCDCLRNRSRIKIELIIITIIIGTVQVLLNPPAAVQRGLKPVAVPCRRMAVLVLGAVKALLNMALEIVQQVNTANFHQERLCWKHTSPRLGTRGKQSIHAKHANHHVTVAPSFVEQEKKTSLATNAMQKCRQQRRRINHMHCKHQDEELKRQGTCHADCKSPAC